MTDWLPVVGVALAGIFTTLALAGRAFDQAKEGASVALRPARRAFWITVALTATLYGLYLAFGEAWLWY